MYYLKKHQKSQYSKVLEMNDDIAFCEELL